MWRKGSGKTTTCIARGNFGIIWSEKESGKELWLWGQGIQYHHTKSQRKNRIMKQDNSTRQGLGKNWDQGYSTTIHVQRIGERTGTVGSGNIQFKNWIMGSDNSTIQKARERTRTIGSGIQYHHTKTLGKECCEHPVRKCYHTHSQGKKSSRIMVYFHLKSQGKK